MNEIVIMRHGEPLTNSLIIAEGTGNQHHAVQQLIRKHEKKMERWGRVEITHLRCGKRGRPAKIYILNEQQATFLITLLDNNDIVLEFKAMLVDQFYKMRMLLKEKQSAEWTEARESGKMVRRGLTDAVQDYVALALEQGHVGTAKFAYSNISKLVKKSFGVRDNASVGQLAAIAALEELLKATIQPMVDAGNDAKQIYSACREKAEAFAGLFIPRLN